MPTYTFQGPHDSLEVDGKTVYREGATYEKDGKTVVSDGKITLSKERFDEINVPPGRFTWAEFDVPGQVPVDTATGPAVVSAAPSVQPQEEENRRRPS